MHPLLIVSVSGMYKNDDLAEMIIIRIRYTSEMSILSLGASFYLY